MANEPSLGEISSFNTDANLVKGSPAVVLDISSGLKGVWDAAHEKAQYDWAKYQNHLKQVSDYAAGHQLDYAGVRSTDIPLISKMANEYYQDIARDPKKLSQIGNDPKWNEIQAKVGQSKQLNSYADKQREFLDKNLHLWTDENKRRYKTFMEGSIDQKPSDFQLDMPKTMDVGKVITNFANPKNGFVKTTPASSEKFFFNKGAKNEKYSGLIEERQAGESLDIDAAMKSAGALYDANSKEDPKSPYGVKDIAQDMFERNTDSTEKESFKKMNPQDPAKAYWQKMIADGLPQGQFKAGAVKLVKDPTQELKDKETLQNLEARNKRSNAEFEHSLKEGDDKKAADALVRMAAGKVQEALANSVPYRGGGTNGNTLYYKMDFTPEQLKGFGIPEKKTSISETGTVLSGDFKKDVDSENIQIPDEINYLKGDKEAIKKPYRVIFYKKYDSDQVGQDGKQHKKGERVVNQEGSPVYDNEKSYDINQEEFLSQYSSDKYDKATAPKAWKYAVEKAAGRDFSTLPLSDLMSNDKESGGRESHTTYSRRSVSGDDAKSKPRPY